MKEEIFGTPHLSSDKIFEYFSKIFPFLESHDMIFASEVLGHPNFSKFASVQKNIEREVLEKGRNEGFVKELSVHNTIYVVNESGNTKSLAVSPLGDHVSPLIKMKMLRQAITNAKITDKDFRLLNKDGKRLKEPIFENARIYLEESKTSNLKGGATELPPSTSIEK